MKLTTVLSWIVILVITVTIPVLNEIKPKSATTRPTKVESINVQFALAGKYAFASSRFEPSTKQQMLKQLDDAAKTPLEQAAAAAVYAEVVGRDEAVDRLSKIESPDATALRAWYETQTPLPADTLARLDWYGRLAQSFGLPDESPVRAPVIASAKKLMVMAFAGVAVFGMVALVAFSLFITAIILIALGKLTFRVDAPLGNAGVYVESFALYLLSYILGSLIVGLWFPNVGIGFHMVPLAAGVLLALIWPSVRGTRFAYQRTDWGIHTGRNLMLEMIYGVLGYFAGLPIVAIAAGISIALVKLSGETPSHPVMTEIKDHPLLILLLAAVFAPITEELLFRGALLSHLRSSVGVVLSALISGFIFAAIHPQGWTLIPVLMSIGAVLAIIRQWRGSLVPSITAHAMHNATLVTIVILLTRQ